MDEWWDFVRGAWRRLDGVWFVQWTDRSVWRAFRAGFEPLDVVAEDAFEMMGHVDRVWPR